MKNHFWKLAVIVLVTLVIAGCSGKKDAAQQSGSTSETKSTKVAAAKSDIPKTESSTPDEKPVAAEKSQKTTVAKPIGDQSKSSSVKPGDICPPSTSKQKQTAAGVKASPVTQKPAAAKAEVAKANVQPNSKQPSESAPKKLPRLLDLGASKCVPCKMMVPVLDELTNEYKGKLEVEFIDVWKDQAAAEKYGVQSIPTQIFFDANGKEFYRHVGYFPKEDILKTFEKQGIQLKKSADK